MAKNTKAKILQKARGLIWTNGYKGTSLNDIVDAAGVSKGAFFHYYPNKESLSADVLNAYANDQLFASMDEAIGKASSVKEGLMGWVESIYKNYAFSEFKGGCMLGNFALEMSDNDPAIREDVKHFFLEWENRLVSHLRPLADEGRLAVEPRQFARLFIAALQGATMTTKAHKDKNRAAREFQAVQSLVDTMISGD